MRVCPEAVHDMAATVRVSPVGAAVVIHSVGDEGAMTAGASAARQALHAAGAPVLFTKDGEGRPVWPTGWSGSVTTAPRVAAAVVTRQSHVGIDLEPVGSETWLEAWPSAAFGAGFDPPQGLPRSARSVHLFTVKEAVFKTVPYEAQVGLLIRNLHVRPADRASGSRDRYLWHVDHAVGKFIACTTRLGGHVLAVAAPRD